MMLRLKTKPPVRKKPKPYLHPDQLEQYQRIAIKHMVRNKSVLLAGGAGLFLEMGLGKTVSALSAFEVLRQEGKARKMLVIAPLRVAEHTWPAEIEAWSHLNHLTYAVVTGSEKNRKYQLDRKVDVYIINRENVPWLCGEYSVRKWPFDVVCIDELSSFKSEKSERWKLLKAKRPHFKYTWGLTGTPAPNGMHDLWSQVYLLDRGERLGDKKDTYLNNFFQEVNVTKEHKKITIKKGSTRQGENYYRDKIFHIIEDICISMQADDWLKIPKLVERRYDIVASAKVMADYEEFEEELILELIDEDEVITAANAASLTNKLLQFANGAIYTKKDRSEWVDLHNAKIEALEDILEAANGNPVLCFYRFKHDVARILSHPKLKRFKPVKLPKRDDGTLDSWNRGEIPFLLAHPASAGHGLNMQHGGHNVVWFGLPWSLELYLQANARLHRKGQKNRVIVHVLAIKDTIDERVARVLMDKEKGQKSLMKYLNVKRREIYRTAA